MAGRAKSEHRGRRRTAGCLIGAGIVGIAFYAFPPLRVVSLDDARAKKEQETFQPREFAEAFWTGDLRKALEDATAADTLLALIRSDPATAKERHGRTAELGNTYYYFVRGTGRVTEVGDEEVAVALAGSGRRERADVILVTASVFGNAIRNATGLLDVNRFASSQDFNNLSHELNLIAESKVLSPFRATVSVGASVEFVGCAEVEDEDRDLDPLKIVPVHLQMTKATESSAVDR